jgi:hypothetical protein
LLVEAILHLEDPRRVRCGGRHRACRSSQQPAGLRMHPRSGLPVLASGTGRCHRSAFVVAKRLSGHPRPSRPHRAFSTASSAQLWLQEEAHVSLMGESSIASFG